MSWNELKISMLGLVFGAVPCLLFAGMLEAYAVPTVWRVLILLAAMCGIVSILSYVATKAGWWR